MSDTALYYTFSTIAQTLAAGFAVLAAFVLYRLQGIEQSLARANQVFDNYREYMSARDIWSLLLSKGFDALDSRMRQIESERRVHFYSRNTLEEPSLQVLLWWPIWKQTTYWLRVALIVTIIDIGLCFISLPSVPSIALNPCASAALSIVTVGAGVAALLVYGRLILALLSPARLGPPEE